MLSSMETELGITVVGPTGQLIRLLRNNPVFLSGRDILRQALPAEQQWEALQDLVANPLQALVDWCARFGMVFVVDGETLKLNDAVLNKECWLPLLIRTHAVSGSPKHILQFAELLGGGAKNAPVQKVTLHLQEYPLGYQPRLLQVRELPKDVRRGDIVTTASTGDTPFLVSYNDILVTPDGKLMPVRGIVLAKVTDEKATAEVLEQPAILGFDMTYRCEGGSVAGWLADHSFDSLKAARSNAEDILKEGHDARIINRITGESVSLN